MTSGYGCNAENESSSRSSRSHEGDSPPLEWGLSPYFQPFKTFKKTESQDSMAILYPPFSTLPTLSA